MRGRSASKIAHFPTCSRSRALFYGYRGRDTEARWLDPNSFLIRQAGGEVRKTPPTRPIRIAGRSVTVLLEHVD